MHFLPMLQ